MIWLVGILCILVFVQIVRAELLFHHISKVLRRADSILSMTESHARINDARNERADEVAREVKAEVKKVVELVPDKVVEKLQTVVVVTSESHDSGAKLPVVKHPPE